MSSCANCRNLRTEIKRLESQVASKSSTIEDLRAGTPEGIRTLMGQYRSLRKLLELLRHAANMADPQSSPAPDKGKGGAVSKKSYAGQPSEADRFRTALKLKSNIDRDLQRFVLNLQDKLGDNGPRNPELKPRCRKEGCSMKNRRQEFGSFKCKECGEPMVEAA